MPFNAESYARRYQVPFFESAVTRPGIEPWSPGLLAITVTIMPKEVYKINIIVKVLYIDIFICKRYIILFFVGLVSLFNGISTFVGYLMPKPFP